MANVLSVPYTFDFSGEGKDAVRERVTPQGPEATVKYKCAWGSRIQLMRDLVGTSVQSGGSFVRIPPYPYPPSPNMYCMPDVQIEGMGKPRVVNGFVAYDYAILTATFRVPALGFDTGQQDESGKPWTITSLNVSAEQIPAPGPAYTFVTSGKSASQSNVAILVPQIEITFKRMWVPYIPMSVLALLTGHVNNSGFLVGDFVAPIGTVLFFGAGTQVVFDSAGNKNQDIEYKFVYRYIEWNKFLTPAGDFDFVTSSGGPPFPPGDLSLLP